MGKFVYEVTVSPNQYLERTIDVCAADYDNWSEFNFRSIRARSTISYQHAKTLIQQQLDNINGILLAIEDKLNENL